MPDTKISADPFLTAADMNSASHVVPVVAGGVNYEALLADIATGALAPLFAQSGIDTTGLTAVQAQQALANILVSARNNLAAILLALPRTIIPFNNAVESGSIGVRGAASSTFRAWGLAAGPGGAFGSFNAVKVPIYPFDSALLPTLLRLRVYDTDYNGTLLADVVQPLPVLTLNAQNDVTFYLGASISTANNVWLQVIGDGHFSCFKISGSPYTSPPYTHERYATSTAIPADFVPASWTGITLVGTTQFNAYAQFGTSPYSIKVIDQGALATTYNYASSTFSGWSFPVGAVDNFNMIDFDLYPWDSAALPTQVRVQVRDTDEAGTILSDKTVTLPTGLKVAQFNRVSVLLDNPVRNLSAHQITVVLLTDGHVGLRKLTSNQYGSGAAVKYQTNESITTIGSWLADSSNKQIYAKLQLVDTSQLQVPEGGGLGLIPEAAAIPYTPVPLLGSTIYAVEGVERAIYIDNILGLADRDVFYDVNVTCTKGRHDNFRWMFTPVLADAGTTTLKFDFYKYNALLASKQVNLTTFAVAATPVTRKLLAIGDSTTAGGVWLSELVRLGALSGITVSTQGTKTSTNIPDSTATNRTVKHEGISGKTVSFFYTDATSPFVFSSAFNFATYLSTNSITLASGDWVTFHLGINDIFGQTTDTGVNGILSTMLTQMNAMIANIQAAVSGVRIGIMVTIPPSYDQDSFGASYGNSQSLWRYRRNVQLVQRWWIDNFDAQTGNSVYLIPVHTALDVYNNMQTASRVLNAYNSNTETYQSNGVHPASIGYFQMSVPVFCMLRSVET